MTLFTPCRDSNNKKELLPKSIIQKCFCTLDGAMDPIFQMKYVTVT